MLFSCENRNIKKKKNPPNTFEPGFGTSAAIMETRILVNSYTSKFLMSALKSGFPNLSAFEFLNWIIFVTEDFPMHFRVFRVSLIGHMCTHTLNQKCLGGRGRGKGAVRSGRGRRAGDNIVPD